MRRNEEISEGCADDADLYAEQATVLDLLARGKLRTQELIPHRFPLDRINDALEAAQDLLRTHAIFVGLEI